MLCLKARRNGNLVPDFFLTRFYAYFYSLLLFRWGSVRTETCMTKYFSESHFSMLKEHPPSPSQVRKILGTVKTSQTHEMKQHGLL